MIVWWKLSRDKSVIYQQKKIITMEQWKSYNYNQTLTNESNLTSYCYNS